VLHRARSGTTARRGSRKSGRDRYASARRSKCAAATFRTGSWAHCMVLADMTLAYLITASRRLSTRGRRAVVLVARRALPGTAILSVWFPYDRPGWALTCSVTNLRCLPDETPGQARLWSPARIDFAVRARGHLWVASQLRPIRTGTEVNRAG
jgi:hypothetical protein